MYNEDIHAPYFPRRATEGKELDLWVLITTRNKNNYNKDNSSNFIKATRTWGIKITIITKNKCNNNKDDDDLWNNNNNNNNKDSNNNNKRQTATTLKTTT